MNGLAHRQRKDYNTALLYIDSSPGPVGTLPATWPNGPPVSATGRCVSWNRRIRRSQAVCRFCLALHQLTRNPGNHRQCLRVDLRDQQPVGELQGDAVWAMNEYINITDSLTNAEKFETDQRAGKKYNQAKTEKNDPGTGSAETHLPCWRWRVC